MRFDGVESVGYHDTFIAGFLPEHDKQGEQRGIWIVSENLTSEF